MADSELERNSNHSAHSSLRESIIEHLFVGEILKALWCKKITQVEVLKPQVDDAGYDIVIECNRNPKLDHSVLRHIQLKSSYTGGKRAFVSVSKRLTEKPNWCVIWVYFNQDTLSLDKFLWYGTMPGQPPPDMAELKIAKYTKGDATGKKAEKPGHREVPKGKFGKSLASIDDVIDKLFPNA
jgi:hypothetical protein